VFLEFTVAGLFFLIFVFGAVEFSNIYYQWNLATKATQLGARLAAVSDPVASNLNGITGLSNSVLPGDPMPAFDFECTATSVSAGTCSNGGTFSPAAMNTIVFGRGDTNRRCTSDVAADPQFVPRNMGMCDVFNRIGVTNVRVRYTNTAGGTSQGYAGRPGGPVATITVELTGMTYTYIMLNGLFGLSSVNLPSFKTTITSEDLRKSGT
jgi:hypothetical protein